MKKQYTAFLNTLLYKIKHESNGIIRPMKLQKLVYFFSAYHYIKYSKWFIERDFLAYPYGPVEESLYARCKSYGSSPITDYIKDEEGNILMLNKEKSKEEIKQVFNSIEEIWIKYGHKGDIELSHLTHIKEGPWAMAWNKKAKSIICKEEIKKYYTKEWELVEEEAKETK